MRRFKEYLAPTLLLTALFSAVAYLVHQQFYTPSYKSDTPEHIIILLKLFYGSKPFYITHPLHISIQASAVFVSASLVVVWTALAYMVAQRLACCSKKIHAKEFIAFFAAIVAVSVALLAYQYLHTFGLQKVKIHFMSRFSSKACV